MRTERFITTDGVDLDVAIASGAVDIARHAGPETIVTLDGASADQLDGVEVVHDQVAGRAHVSVRLPKSGLFRSLMRQDVSVQVAVPAGSRVDVSTATADITVAGCVIAAKCQSASGSIRVEEVEGDVDVRTASGDVRVGRVTGRAELTSASGDVTADSVGGVATVKSASGDVRLGSVGVALASTGSGDVAVGSVGDAELRSASGDVGIEAVRSGRVDAKTMSGDINVGVCAGTAVRVDAQSVSGELHSEIELSIDPSIPDTTAGEQAELMLRTVSGDVVVRRAQVAARS